MIQENATTTSHRLSLPAQYDTHESYQEDKKLRAFTINKTIEVSQFAMSLLSLDDELRNRKLNLFFSSNSPTQRNSTAKKCTEEETAKCVII